ncbi:MAG: hypothetical protein PHP46_03330, partial [Candidatus Omnitrophica bacterium]|nr:hypothetical protein [Candidatus Omnitrophota bacterium]
MQTRNVASRVLIFIFLGLIAFSLLVFFSGCFGAGGRKGFLEVSGRIEGREHNVGSKIAGRVDEVYTNEGKEVASGEPLALIYSKQTT